MKSPEFIPHTWDPENLIPEIDFSLRPEFVVIKYKNKTWEILEEILIPCALLEALL